MKRLFFAVGVVCAVCLLASCGPGPSQNSESTSETGETADGEPSSASQTETYGGSVEESERFLAFLQRFPVITSPASFPPVKDDYSQSDLNVIEAEERNYLNEDLFFYGFDKPIFYYGSLKVHPQVYSVVAYQATDLPYYEFILINYDAAGRVLSSKTLAHYDFGSGVIHRSEAIVEGNVVRIIAIEEGRTEDYRIDEVSDFKLNASGTFLPDGLAPPMLTTYHEAVAKDGEYLVDNFCMGPDDYASEAFQLRPKGDSVIYLPFPDGHAHLLQEVKVNQGSYQLTFSNLDDLQDVSTLDLTLIPVANKAGLYQLGKADSEDYLIAEPNLPSYPQRKFPCLDDKSLIIPAGLATISLGYSLTFIDNLARDYQLNYKVESEQHQGNTTNFHRLYDSQKQLALEIEVNDRSQVASITLLTPLFKTGGSITVGSTLGELMYAHEYVTAHSGEDCVLVSIDWYKQVTFQLDHIAGAPGTQLRLEDLDRNLRVSRIIIR